MVFGERYFRFMEKNGAIKYIRSTHLDKFSYFPKHYNFHETMLYSQYPFENFQVEICVLSYNLKYSDEMTVSQNNFNSAQKLSIIDMNISVSSCFVCIE